MQLWSQDETVAASVVVARLADELELAAVQAFLRRSDHLTEAY